jgi:hypothetical protein
MSAPDTRLPMRITGTKNGVHKQRQLNMITPTLPVLCATLLILVLLPRDIGIATAKPLQGMMMKKKKQMMLGKKTNVPTVRPTSAPVIACSADMQEIASLGTVLDTANNAMLLAQEAASRMNCTDLIVAAASPWFTNSVCEEAKAALVSSFIQDGVCFAALAALQNSTSVVADVPQTRAKEPPRFLQGVCGGNPRECNSIRECQVVSALCDYRTGAAVAVAVAAVSSAVQRILVNQFGAIIVAILLRAAVAGATALSVTAAIPAVAGLAIATGAAYLCQVNTDACQNAGTAIGVDCNGAACCPGETGSQCGINCCCCPALYKPCGPACECVRDLGGACNQ